VLWKEEEKYEESKTTLNAHISRTAWLISSKFGIGGAPPWGNLHRKICVSFFGECRATDAWKQHFLDSCKIHICLSCTPDFLGCMTHYYVSWFLVSCHPESNQSKGEWLLSPVTKISERCILASQFQATIDVSKD